MTYLSHQADFTTKELIIVRRFDARVKLFCEVYSSQFPDPDAFPFLLKSLAREWPIMHQPISDCVEEDPAKRPTMNSIVHQLNTFTK